MGLAEVVDVEKVETDRVVLRNSAGDIRVRFADNWAFTKEDSADLFRPFQGKQAVIPIEGPFFIAVDFQLNVDGSFRVWPMHLAISSVERSSRPPRSLPGVLAAALFGMYNARHVRFCDGGAR
jgi:hypothetical protein